MYARAFADLDGHIWEPSWLDPAAEEGGAGGQNDVAVPHFVQGGIQW